MILKRLKIKNVRSYVEEEINFPAGSVLLAGEIGAGKSSILQAVEFALFGLRKSKLSGKALLKHGSREGFVELEFTIAGKNVIVHRVLKSQNEDIRQDSGFIVIDGVRSDLTALEIKSKMLDMLGYPQSFLQKTKNLVFTYTVYTPQEEMKHILQEEPDNRQDILRKVFGMDKYKTVQQNVIILSKYLNIQSKQYELLLSRKPEKIDILNQKKMQLTNITQQTQLHKLSYDTANLKHKESQTKVVVLEESLAKARVIATKQGAVKERLDLTSKSIDRIYKEIHILEQNIASLQSLSQPELPHNETKEELNKRLNTQQTFVHQLANKKNILLERKEHLVCKYKELYSSLTKRNELVDQLSIKQKEYDALVPYLDEYANIKQTLPGLENDVIDVSSKLKEVEVHLNNAKKTVQQISSLSSCPTCLQEVGFRHKSSVLEKQQYMEKDFALKHSVLLEKKGVLERSLTTYREKLEHYSKKEKLASMCKVDLVYIDQNLKALEQVPSQIESVKKDVLDTNKELTMLDKQNIDGMFFAIEEDKKKLAAIDLYQEALLRYEQQKQMVEEKQKQIIVLGKHKQELLLALQSVQQELLSLTGELQSYSHLENDYAAARKELESNNILLRNSEVAWKTSIKEEENLISSCNDLEKEISELNVISDKMNNLNGLVNWLNETFSNLMVTLEKHLFVAIHQRFSSLFSNWFSLLMDDESINVRLDDVFTPIVMQNGYDVPFEHLSGGERTSCALAYRLALNKVINDVQSTIKTREILILDEPTEGFSSDQLDRVRLVLENLKLNQLIIVSHETKVEGFVDHVLRVVKDEQGSRVIG